MHLPLCRVHIVPIEHLRQTPDGLDKIALRKLIWIEQLESEVAWALCQVEATLPNTQRTGVKATPGWDRLRRLK
jgi:hypothetical protein